MHYTIMENITGLNVHLNEPFTKDFETLKFANMLHDINIFSHDIKV